MMLIKTVRLTLLACVLLPYAATGQKGPDGFRTRYGFTLGIAWYQARDNVLNSIRHQGPSILAGFSREGVSDGAIHLAGLSFAFAPLTDRYSPDRTSLFFHPTLEIRYVRKVAQLTDELALLLGGTTGWSTRFSFYENWDQAHGYWLTSSHLGLAGSLLRSMGNGNTLQLDMDAPLLAAVSRPPERFDYKEVKADLGWMLNQIHSDMQVTSLNEHTALRARLSYDRKGGGILVHRFFWETEYTSTRLASSRPLTTLTHTLGFSHLF
jgi:hypothetical protein